MADNVLTFGSSFTAIQSRTKEDDVNEDDNMGCFSLLMEKNCKRVKIFYRGSLERMETVIYLKNQLYKSTKIRYRSTRSCALNTFQLDENPFLSRWLFQKPYEDLMKLEGLKNVQNLLQMMKMPLMSS